MILLLDAGNTRIKWGCLAEGALRPGGACPTADIAALRRAWTQWRPNRAVAACVADESTRGSLDALLTELGAEVHWVRAAAAEHGVVNAYQPPESLGPDRYAALVAVARRFARDCVVASVGTAMTADMLTADGRFLGGCIAPGPDLMRASLFEGTARVGQVAGDAQDFPRDTGAAVASGIALALRGVVNGMRESLAVATGSGDAPCAVVLTGGARACLRSRLAGAVFEVDDLVLEGLAWIARDRGCDG